MNTQLTEIWEKSLEIIKTSVNEVVFKTWIKTLIPVDISANTITIKVESDLFKDVVESRYLPLIENSINAATSDEYIVELITIEGDQSKNTALDNIEESDAKQEDAIQTDAIEICTEDINLDLDPDSDLNSDKFQYLDNAKLNPKYTFDSFVIGNSNRFAHAASLAVAESPAKAYNPLFIYGGVGLGKTHLMHAIGHNILLNNPNAKVYYVSSEKFTNELINAIKDDKNIEFRNKYRSVDVLLIDDIQFIAGKVGTQEEFFHTFNALHEAVKQIIISSDRPPKEIPTLEDRLRTRFEWGLIADIQPPDFETRMAILKKKSDIEEIDIPNEVMGYIVTKIKTNIRELEGALLRLKAYATLTKQSINIDMAIEALKDIINNKDPKQISIETIQNVVSNYYNIRMEDFKSSKRTRNVAFPRQVAMYLSRKLTDFSLPRIGEEFGGRDHSTVIHAYEKISDRLNNDENLQNAISELERKIAD